MSIVADFAEHRNPDLSLERRFDVVRGTLFYGDLNLEEVQEEIMTGKRKGIKPEENVLATKTPESLLDFVYGRNDKSKCEESTPMIRKENLGK